ncbi:hypothetical protein LQZ18_19050 [Lachnospiraceae bacterium ZAX-1]
MRMILKKDCRIVVWGGIYTAFIYMAYRVSIQMQGKDFIGFLYGNLFGLQKYFWDVSFAFHLYLLILKKPFASPMLVSRCKRNYFAYVTGYGARICGVYSAYTFLLFYGIPILFGLPTAINWDIAIRFLNLFFFLFTVYLCYLLLLIKTNRQMLSMLAGFVANLFILMFYYVLKVVDDELSYRMGDLLMASYPWLAACMLLLIAFTVRRKEWLDDEK